MTKRLWSLNALAIELARDRRTVANALADVPPDGTAAKGEKAWFLTTALASLDAEPVGREASDRLSRERARQAAAMADRIETENARRRGELIEAPIVKRIMDEELGKIRSALLNLPGAVANDLTHLSPAEKARVANVVVRSVDDLLAVLRDGAGVARDAGAMQIGEAEAAAGAP